MILTKFLFMWASEDLGRWRYPVLISLGMLSGVIGSFVGSPADLVMIRMISDINNPPGYLYLYTIIIFCHCRLIKLLMKQ